jgi:hypothetical protein
MIKTRSKLVKCGDIINNWAILGVEFRIKGRWCVVTKCQCGFIKIFQIHKLINNRCSKCEFCKRGYKGLNFKKPMKEKSPNWKGYKEIPKTFLGILNKSAKIRQIDVDIKIEDIWHQYVGQDKLCALSGMEIGFENKTASVDRIDSKIGYLINNIHIVHKDVNISKQSLNIQHYINLCHLVTDYDHNLPLLEITVPKRWSKFTGTGNILISLWNRIKKRANKKGLEFSLSINDAWELYLSQNGRCFYSKIPIYFGLPGIGGKNHVLQNGEATASLDRIDSNKGYTKSNVSWTHVEINFMKYWHSESYFKNLCSLISAKHNPSKDYVSLLNSKTFY